LIPVLDAHPQHWYASTYSVCSQLPSILRVLHTDTPCCLFIENKKIWRRVHAVRCRVAGRVQTAGTVAWNIQTVMYLDWPFLVHISMKVF
jgi:hypothetical protein